MKKPNILVVGSCGMDFTFGGDTFPSEGATVLGKSFSTAPGGKGANQARQAALLGANVTFVGKLGCDSFGKQLTQELKDVGIDTSKMLYNPEVPSAAACIILENTAEGVKNRIIVVSGSQMTFTKEDVAFLETDIGSYDMVILQLEINMEINELVAQYAHKAGVPVMLNSAPSAPLSEELLSNLAYISPNEHEAKDLTGVEIHTLDDARKAAELLRVKKVDNVLITLGSAGAVFYNGRELLHSPCVKTKVVDPTAAGDSFVGAFCTAVSAGMPVKEAMVFANHTASVTVSRRGAQPSLPTLNEVLAQFARTGADYNEAAVSVLR